MLMLDATAENSANACASATTSSPEAGGPVPLYNLSARKSNQDQLNI
jgi:hypothetical protein